MIPEPCERQAAESRFELSDLRAWTRRALERVGLSVLDARLVADNLVDAEARNVRSHGLLLLPTYVQRIKRGGIRSAHRCRVIVDGGPLIRLDADGAPGQFALHWACDVAKAKVKAHGVSVVSLINSNHVGMLATYGAKLAAEGCLGLVMTTAGPSMCAHHGRGAALGNNALCCFAPTTNEPWLFDMATAVVACGKLRMAALEGREVPSGWLVDSEGRATVDPKALDGGGVLPLGGHKGYGLAVAVDVLTAILGGGCPSARMPRQRAEPDRQLQASQTIIAIDANDGDMDHPLAARLTDYLEELRSLAPLCPEEPVLAPGDPELLSAAHSQRAGLLIARPLVSSLDALAVTLDVPLLSSLCRSPLPRGGSAAGQASPISTTTRT